jgi:hypothetical protein
MITITYSDGRQETMTEQEFRARSGGKATKPARRDFVVRRPRRNFYAPQGNGVDARFDSRGGGIS